MKYETVIGLEVHAQLLTKSKMFCSCSTNYINSAPDSHVCPVCLGMPGVMPTMNKQAIEFSIMTGMALNCTVSNVSKFDRKSYPYPDLMKGYQISQYDMPLSVNGWMTIDIIENSKRIGITRVHLEEDVAKLLHRTDDSGEMYSLIDVNRSGMPLMEIVSDPDMSSPEEARRYLMKLHHLLRYIGVSTANMEEGSFRCDANISIRSTDGKKAFPKVEVKNMNSFKSVFSALKYEEERQRKVAEEGGQLIQETRGWVDEEEITVSHRSKEQAHDYRYFPEPDLPPLTIDSKWIEELKARLPELPDPRHDRFMLQYNLSSYDAGLLMSSRASADFFEECVLLVSPQKGTDGQAKAVTNWMLGEFLRLLKIKEQEVDESRITPSHLAGMLGLINQGTLSNTLAKQVFQDMFESGKLAADIVAEKGLTQISGADEIEEIIDIILKENPDPVKDFLEGKEQALQFLVGQVMKKTKGRAKPDLVNKLLREKLG